MIPILCLAMFAQGPRIEGASGRVLLFDAESGARRVGAPLRDAPEDGVLELGAASRVRYAIAGRMALELEGPSSFEWRGARQHLPRVAKACWDWRAARCELGLQGGWSLRGGPGAYELEAESGGHLLRNLAGAPIEVLDAGVVVLVVQAGGEGRFAPPRAQLAPPAAWEVHEWPWQAAHAEAGAEPRQWWPATFACADVAPPRLAAVALASAARAPAAPATAAPATAAPSAPARVPPAAPPAPEPREVEDDQAARWPQWLRARVHWLFDGLFERLATVRAWLARWRALHEFGVAFDPLAPFEVSFADDRLELRLAPHAERAERVRGTSVYLMQPGSAIVVARGGRLLSHAGAVDVRSRAR